MSHLPIRFSVGLALALAFAAAAANGAAAATNNIFTVAGTGTFGFSGDDFAATAAQINQPRAVAATADGGFLIADMGNHCVRRVAPTGAISTAAGTCQSGGFSGDGGPAIAAQLDQPRSVAVTADGGFLIADETNDRIRRVAPDGRITTVAGTSTGGFSGDGGPATAAQLEFPNGVAATADGGFLIADRDNNRVRRVSPGGTITTVAGTGTGGFSGDGGPATAAQLNLPRGVTATADGGFLIADTVNHRVRRVSPGGTITTVAGTGTGGFSGDGGPATAAQLNGPNTVAATADGGFLIADFSNHRVRRVSPGGTITTVAGTGTGGFSGDGGPATAAQLFFPVGVAATAEGGFLIADEGNHRIRFVDADLRPGPQGPEGPAGADGQAAAPLQGPAGAAGSPGAAGAPGTVRDLLAFVIAEDPLRARRKRPLTVRYASTMAAAVTFDVLKGRRRMARRTVNARAGRNRTVLRLALAPGRYTLAARAVATGQTVTDRVTLIVSR